MVSENPSFNPLSANIEPLPDDLAQLKKTADRLKSALEQVILGQSEVIHFLLVSLLSEGHILIEGVPGTAKTTLVKCLAQLIHADFRRIQLTPDLLPSEIIGTSIFDFNTRSFSFKQGPVFTDLLLADEINRTPPKTQSALLEAMEEHQVTIDGRQSPLSPLFTVIATLNPVEFEGTYPLPEAQLDRFLMKLVIDYPTEEAEKQLLANFSKQAGTRFLWERHLEPVATQEEILNARRCLNQIQADDSVIDYILKIVQDTRKNPNLELGCSPRAALSLLAAARSHAALSGYRFITPDHVKTIAPAVLRHRIMLSSTAELDGLNPDDVIGQTLNKIPVPR